MTAETSPFSPEKTARRILRGTAAGTLATLDEGGGPFASLATVATRFAGEPLFLLSKLAVHTKNLDRDSRASLLLVAAGGEGGDPLAGARLTLTGRIVPDGEAASRVRFLARHEEAAGYADFGDFGFYRMAVESGHLVAGFGRIVRLTPDDLILSTDEASGLMEAEAGAVAHMNADHADALQLYATRLCGMTDGEWKATGCDPDGMDLRAGAARTRLDFPERVRTSGELRRVLVELAQKARAPA